MLSAFANAFRIPELRQRILFTLGVLTIYRIGCHVPIPGVDLRAMEAFVESQAGGILGFLDLFSGGAWRQFSVLALGIMPYISTSIIMQLLTAVVPPLERLSKEGEAGRRKITQYTRYGTVLLCIVQGLAVTSMLSQAKDIQVAGELRTIVYNPGPFFTFLTILTLTTGTIFVMWLGEQVTERGIGNGMSLLIFAGIVARLPQYFMSTVTQVQTGLVPLWLIVIFVLLMAGLLGFTVLLSQAVRKIPVQSAQRVIGRRVYQGQSQYLPLKVDTSGVIAVIFASSILIFPSQIARFLQSGQNPDAPLQVVLETFVNFFQPGTLLYSLFYALLIVFFCYFYTAIIFNPIDIADNMKKYGSFIPGIRPGKPTSDYVNTVLTRLTLGGAFAVALIAIIPDFLGKKLEVGWYFGGTTLLILVGVSLDTMKQVESHLLMRHYEGFMKKGRLRSRTGF